MNPYLCERERGEGRGERGGEERKRRRGEERRGEERRMEMRKKNKNPALRMWGTKTKRHANNNNENEKVTRKTSESQDSFSIMT